MSLVFYDTETTGIDAPFNQILQFAAIRTDADLNEIERFEIRSRLLPHIVPAPGAMQVTGITVAQLTDQSFPSHYEMVRTLRDKLLSWSPCNFVGFNSLGFDEHFFRQALYQTLHHPYLTNCDGNTRSDVMRIVQAASLFVPQAVAIPTGSDGKPVFKLDRVAPANGFVHEKAHDAMGDVEATIFLSRLIQERAPEVWSAAMRFSKKAAVVDFIEGEIVFSLSDFFFGKPYSWLVTLIGGNAANNAERYVYNLGVNPNELIDLNAGKLFARLSQSPKPVRTLRTNAAPMLMSAIEAPDIASAREFEIDELESRANIVKSDPDFCDRLIEAFEGLKEEKCPSCYVEEQIYDGFTSDEDMSVLDEFHTVPWDKRMKVLTKLKDARLKVLGRQLIHVERPEVLDEATRHEHSHTRATRLLGTDGDVPWLTLPKAIKELEHLLSSAGVRSASSLRDYHAYLLTRVEQARTAIWITKSKTQVENRQSTA